MLSVNSVGPSFKGIWGDIEFKNEKPVVNYYPFIDETEDEIKQAIDRKLSGDSIDFHNPLPKWYEKGMKIKAIVTEPLQITKADFAKFNRGFMSDTLAKLLLK